MTPESLIPNTDVPSSPASGLSIGSNLYALLPGTAADAATTKAIARISGSARGAVRASNLIVSAPVTSGHLSGPGFPRGTPEGIIGKPRPIPSRDPRPRHGTGD